MTPMLGGFVISPSDSLGCVVLFLCSCTRHDPPAAGTQAAPVKFSLAASSWAGPADFVSALGNHCQMARKSRKTNRAFHGESGWELLG